MSSFTGAGGTAYSSGSYEWETPRELFRRLDEAFGFTLDPCSTDANAKCADHYTASDDGLSAPWRGTAFVNPPYGRGIGRWVEKSRREHEEHGVRVLMLIPARTDTAWFHEHVLGVANVRFLRGRIYFEIGGAPQGRAPFPSMLVGYGLDPADADLGGREGGGR